MFREDRWNLNHTAGGSSGGSAASVAAGIVPIAESSDGGGSTRSPATLNGLIGHKATRGTIPLPNGYSYDSAYMLMEGFISKSVRDQAAIYDEIMKFSDDAPHFIPPALPTVPFKEQIKTDPRKLKIAVNTGDWARRGADKSARPVSDEVRTRTKTIAKQLEKLGHEVVYVTEEDMGIDFASTYEAFKWFYLYLYDWKAQAEKAGMEINSETLEPAYQAAIRYVEANPMPVGMIDQARATNGMVASQWAAFFGEYDILLSPADGSSAMKGNDKGSLSPFVELKTEEEYLDWVENHLDDARYFIPANVIGFPAMALPAGTYKNGLPAGVQLQSKWGNDGLIFKLAAQLERAHPENFNMIAPNHISKR